jgi:RNA polymerase sigma factor (sigma-70 family)
MLDMCGAGASTLSWTARGMDATKEPGMVKPRRRREDDETPEDAVLRLVRDHTAELLHFASRFCWCADDAQDAYQRAVEILVRRMRTDPPGDPLNWLRTVLKNECVTLRTKRAEIVGRNEADLDGEEARNLEDPAERAIGFERLRHTAEALQRLKPQELTALLMRAEGHSYKEIAASNDWTYTKTNRSITEGRRALLIRLGAIESGAECDRWFPLLSLLADGEATTEQLAELRPHLRACPGCRATLRDLHDAPRRLAALVPPALVPLGTASGTVVDHAETVVHALVARTTLAVARVQSALDALSGTKLAAVAASSAAIAGGGVAIEQVATPPRPSHVVVQSVADRGRTASAGLVVAALPAAAARTTPRGSGGSAGRPAPKHADSEFSFEAPASPEPSSPPEWSSSRPLAHTAVAPRARAPAAPTSPADAEFAGP